MSALKCLFDTSTHTPQLVDFEQSLFFFRFSESNARAGGHLRVSRFARRTTEKRETARSLLNLEFQCEKGVLALGLEKCY